MSDSKDKLGEIILEMLNDTANDQLAFTDACTTGDWEKIVYLFNKVQLDKLRLIADIIQDSDLKVNFLGEVSTAAVKLENLHHGRTATE